MENHNSQGQGLLEDLLTPITNTWTTFCNNQDSTLFPSVFDNNFNEEEDSFLASNSSFLQLISSSLQPTFPNYDISSYSSYEQQVFDYEYDDKPIPMVGFPTMLEQEDDKNHEKHDQVVVSDNYQVQDVFSIGQKESKSKKVDGQPSKNLMAERRRRKRLNDRLSMLRSIVPRISKMDRTSILGDTIEYMKELQEKIRNLKAQDLELVSNSLNWMVNNNKDLKMNEAQARNIAKFEVERRNVDTRIQISCSTKPGLLLSTMNTIETLGLDIQQCVISSFGDFNLQASCSEALENRVMMSSDEIKQILFRNAGYGGKGL
uniref:transcription factor bHLH93-like n=1 Tax=Erigeron canadensis TaxID=72917 RepID=UPI001CB8AE3D|nr:transcription factor bHLH93-like [Erigeron canadensis]